MSIREVKAFFAARGMEDKVLEFATSSATVELAAQTVGVIPARIAKTLSFMTAEGPLLVVTAGDAKIDNHKYKETFGCKAKMLTPEEAVELIGHAVGGVCPFAVKPGVKTCLNVSLQRFTTVFPACGSSNSAIELTCEELYELSEALLGWMCARAGKMLNKNIKGTTRHSMCCGGPLFVIQHPVLGEHQSHPRHICRFSCAGVHTQSADIRSAH